MALSGAGISPTVEPLSADRHLVTGAEPARTPRSASDGFIVDWQLPARLASAEDRSAVRRRA